jgi:predicted transposase/invertase (TIGR01784 family)
MLAEARELQRRDNQAALEYDLMEARERSLKEGLEKGLEQGITQGLEQGSRQSRLEIARKMKTMGFSEEQVTTATGLSTEDIAGL